MAIENSMLGATHACANPLTARFGLTHGHAVSVMLPHVVRFNAAGDADVRVIYRELAMSAGLAMSTDPAENAVNALTEAMERLLVAGGFPKTLAEAGVDRSAIPALAAEAARQWTAQFNPRPVTEENFAALFEAAHEGVPLSRTTSCAS